MGGGATRADGRGRPLPREVRSVDLLPTRAVLERVKAEAWRRACLKAFGLGWPVAEAGLGVVRLAPALALVALEKLCPQVSPARCAICLGLDPGEANALANRAGSLGPWAGEQASEIFELMRNGEAA